MRICSAAWIIVGTLAIAGCSGDVDSTDDSVRMEMEIPKVEIGEGKVDLDPKTDHDVDIDTPKPGDS